MRETQLTLPELGLIAATRGILGAGVALLLAGLIPEGQRKTVGWTLFSIGAISTIPLALTVFGRSQCRKPAEVPDSHDRQRDSDDEVRRPAVAAGI
jgi:hypothetical protein